MKPIAFDLNWGSHLPVLMKVMSVSTGDVLELGAGLYSTPYLYWICKDQKRSFVSIESNFDWWKMVWDLKNIEHKDIIPHEVDDLTSAIYISDWNELEFNNNAKIDVVLVDHAPSKRRIVDIKALANQANYIVVHDTQRNYKFCDYKQIYPLFKYRFDYKDENWDPKVPHTTVLSNFINLQEVLK